MHKFAPALATGNAVIIKPASDNPLTVMKIVKILLDSGVPGNVLQLVTGSGGRIYDETWYEPTLLDNVTPDMDIARDMECFGPVMPVIGFDTEEEAVRIANNTIYGLQAGVMTKDMKKAIRVAEKLECGGVVINGSGNYRDLDQPFGGNKKSGIGREGVSVTLNEYTQEKSYIMKGILA